MTKGVSLFILLVVISGRSFAQETIYWQTYHLPPIIIKEGEGIGTGVVDRMLKLIVDRLPEYKHQMPLTSHARAMEDMKSGKFVCHPSMYNTKERERFAVFSIVSVISPSHRLIVHKDAKLVTSSSGAVALDSLIRSTDWVFGLTEGRSYGLELDPMLALLPKDRLLSVSALAADVNHKLVSMKRLDATIGYPYEISYFNSRANDELQLKAIPIQGTTQYVRGSLACPKNAWGKKIIKRIDEILLELRAQPEYLDVMSYWWPEERNTASYKNALNKYFGTTKSN